jgi:hypothetical protein
MALRLARSTTAHSLTEEGRAQARREVDGAGGSAVSEDHDDADDEQERDQTNAGGNHRHQRRVITYGEPTAG